MGLSKVVVPDKNNKWQEIISKCCIEEAPLVEIEIHFTQTKGTSLTVSPTVYALGLLGIWISSDDILKEDCKPLRDKNTDVTNILEHLKWSPSIQIKM